MKLSKPKIGVLSATVVVLAACVYSVFAAVSQTNGNSIKYNLERGENSLNKGDYDAALDFYKTAAEIDSRETKAYLGMYEVYLKSNKPEKAEEALNTALEYAPDSGAQGEIILLLDGISTYSVTEQPEDKTSAPSLDTTVSPSPASTDKPSGTDKADIKPEKSVTTPSQTTVTSADGQAVTTARPVVTTKATTKVTTRATTKTTTRATTKTTTRATTKATTRITTTATTKNPVDSVIIGGVTYSTSLKSLDLSGLGLTDISAIKDMKALTYLKLDDNSISDISALSGLTNLKSLYISNNNISDASAVKNLKSLTNLSLYNNNVSDISPFMGLSSLYSLDLRENSVSDSDADKLGRALPYTDVFA